MGAFDAKRISGISQVVSYPICVAVCPEHAKILQGFESKAALYDIATPLYSASALEIL